ncbi:unnamed protein product, partial [Polarella glacialis]
VVRKNSMRQTRTAHFAFSAAAVAMSRVAEVHAECPLSFKPLFQGPVAILVDSSGKRLSPHFYRLDAAEEFLARAGSGNGNGQALCPFTQREIAGVKAVPSLLDDPKGWFRACDADGDRKLSREEVVSALKAQLPLDNRAIDRFRTEEAAWRSWDADGSGFIEYVEVMDESKGLLKFVRDSFLRSSEDGVVPDLRKDREAWFRYWDEDNSGVLEFEEVLRAFAKSFHIDLAGVEALRESLQAVWGIFDSDNSGAVDRREFMLPYDGLADTVLATMT